jgi:hypothetical protein
MTSKQILESIFNLAASHSQSLRDAPTIASKEAMENALRVLPKSLPGKGIGDEAMFELVRQYLIPALAVGQSGPR